jgi:hypothetical protein
VDTPSQKQSLANFEDVDEPPMAFVPLLAAARNRAAPILMMSVNLLAIGDRVSKQCGCIEGHGPSLDFTDHLEHFGMIPGDDPDVGRLPTEHPFEARLFVGTYVISELVETQFQSVLVVVILSA